MEIEFSMLWVVDLCTNEVAVSQRDDVIRTMPGFRKFPVMTQFLMWEVDQHPVINPELNIRCLLVIIRHIGLELSLSCLRRYPWQMRGMSSAHLGNLLV